MSVSRRVFSSGSCRGAAGLVLTCMVAACGGGGTDADDDSGSTPDPIPAASQCDGTGAIEGGGRNKLSGIVSQVANDGNLTVGGVRFSTTGAQVMVDGTSATIGAIEPGQVVNVSGDIDFARQAGCAQTVDADAAMIGAIEYVDATDRIFRVLGQQVRVAPDAIFGDGLALETIKVGDRVRISGAPSLGSILASRVDAADLPDGYFIAGSIAALDTGRKTFVVNGIFVAYAGASLIGPTDALQDGSRVRVWGSAFGLDDDFPGAAVARPARVDFMDFGLSVQPSPAFVSPGATLQFSAWGAMGPVSWRVSGSNGSACAPNVCGEIDDAGRYTAPSVEPPVTVLVTATSVADPRMFASATVAVSQTPGVLPGPYILTGDVASPSGPIADAEIDIWVQQPRMGYSYYWANGPLRSDGGGHFAAPNLPDSRLSVFVFAGNHVQPCAVTPRVTGNLSVQVSMLPVEAFDSSDPPRPAIAPEPSVTGQIYERTAAGRQPIAGASVWLEDPLGISFANTLSDREGDYFICNVGSLPTWGWLTVSKEGFQMRSVGPVESGASSMLDIELVRLSP